MDDRDKNMLNILRLNHRVIKYWAIEDFNNLDPICFGEFKVRVFYSYLSGPY